jgi:hypothetical protein
MRDDGARGGHGYFGASRGHGTRPHTGIDIRGDLNITPVVAFLAGTVSAIGNQPRGYGNIVTIDHGNGLTSRYSHLQNGSISAAGIVVGQQVGQGQPARSEIPVMRETQPHIFILKLGRTTCRQTRRRFLTNHVHLELEVRTHYEGNTLPAPEPYIDAGCMSTVFVAGAISGRTNSNFSESFARS